MTIISRTSKGFTLLELIIVIIVIGVLATLAIPRLGAMIQFSKGVEALNAIGVVNRGIKRCVLQQGDIAAPDYSRCDEFDEINIDDPGASPGATFTYGIGVGGGGGRAYRIRAERSDLGGGGACGGSADHWIEYSYYPDGSSTREGDGYYSAIK